MADYRSQVSPQGVMYPELTQDLLDLGLKAAQQAVRDVAAGKNLGDPAEYSIIKILEACGPELASRERAIFQAGLIDQLKAKGTMNPLDLLARRDRR